MLLGWSLISELKVIRADSSLGDLKEKCRKILEVWLTPQQAGGSCVMLYKILTWDYVFLLNRLRNLFILLCNYFAHVFMYEPFIVSSLLYNYVA